MDDSLIIFSCDLPDSPLTHKRMQNILAEMWRYKIPVKAAFEFHNGVKAKSFMCGVRNQDQADLIMSICSLHQKESYIEIKAGSLVGVRKFLTGKADEYLGIWTEMTEIDEKVDRFVDLESKKVYKLK